jgi:hypothetical protein
VKSRSMKDAIRSRRSGDSGAAASRSRSCCRPDEVLELGASHPDPPRRPRKIAQRVRGSRAPANGEHCRRSRARSLGSTRSEAISSMSLARTSRHAWVHLGSMLPLAAHRSSRCLAASISAGSKGRRRAISACNAKPLSSAVRWVTGCMTAVSGEADVRLPVTGVRRERKDGVGRCGFAEARGKL